MCRCCLSDKPSHQPHKRASYPNRSFSLSNALRLRMRAHGPNSQRPSRKHRKTENTVLVPQTNADLVIDTDLGEFLGTLWVVFSADTSEVLFSGYYSNMVEYRIHSRRFVISAAAFSVVQDIRRLDMKVGQRAPTSTILVLNYHTIAIPRCNIKSRTVT